MNENDGKVEEKKKECPSNEHYFRRILKSALIPLDDGTGLGFTTWVCVYCGKKVKVS